MKKLTLFCFLTLVISQIIVAQNYGWKDISANIPDTLNYNLSGLSDVYFVSDKEGWISVSSDALILHTTDGGETFEVQTTQFSTEALYMLNENEGYAGGDQGRVYRTTDGGNNWIAIGSIGVTLADIDFANDTIGYACGDNGVVFKIISQGVTNLYSGLSSDLAGISAPSVDNLWVCGGGQIVYFDGSTFTFQSGPVGSYNSIFLLDDEEGWVVGTGGIIGHTLDSGNNWQNLAPANPSIESLFDIFFLTQEIGWTVGANGTILSTSNGGDNWTIVGSGLTTSLLRGVHFTSPDNGYVVGNEKTLLKYTEVTGIGDKVENIKFEIYPNPTQNKIQIQCSEFKNAGGFIEILSIEGKFLFEEELCKGNENIEINMSQLESGMYLCKLSIDNRSSTKILIKE